MNAPPPSSPSLLPEGEGSHLEEQDLTAYAEVRQFPIIPCDLCGSQPTLQRKQIKLLLREWEKRHPGRVETIFRSLQNVSSSHLLDRGLFDFAALGASGNAAENGDKVFDLEEEY